MPSVSACTWPGVVEPLIVPAVSLVNWEITVELFHWLNIAGVTIPEFWVSTGNIGNVSISPLFLVKLSFTSWGVLDTPKPPYELLATVWALVIAVSWSVFLVSTASIRLLAVPIAVVFCAIFETNVSYPTKLPVPSASAAICPSVVLPLIVPNVLLVNMPICCPDSLIHWLEPPTHW